MNKTAIEWCDMTWNPVTGCLHGCPYCYARKVANRFGTAFAPKLDFKAVCITIKKALKKRDANGKVRTAQYPFGFEPTFHSYKLEEPAKRKKPTTIFVCSMADLFGEWVPDEWIREVFDACKAAPWHNYLFLTKNPQRYCKLANAGKLPKLDNFWYGSTITKANDCMFAGSIHWNTFLSIEPLLEPLDVGIGSFGGAKWIIIGAETGNRAGKVRPEREWIDNIVEAAKLTQAAVFMKDSLIPIVGEENMLRELPEGLRAYEAGHGKNKEAHDGKK
jgi:protein gp37